MVIRTAGLMIGACLLAGGATAWGAPAATTAAVGSDEDALIHHGIELRKARDDLSARAEFQKAYDLTHSPRSAAQLGLAEFALGRFDDAEAHVSEALRASRDPWINKYRKELDHSLAEIKNHVARVEVIGEPPGAEVYVNGRLAGKLPLGNPVAVSEGQVDVELRAPGFVLGSRNVTLSGGQYQRLVIRLERERAAAGGGGSGTVAKAEVKSFGAEPAPQAVGASGAVPGVDEPAGSPPPAPPGADVPPGGADGGPSVSRRAIKWTSLGLAGAALATGIATAAIAQSNNATFESLNGGNCRDNGGRAYDQKTGNPFPACQPSLDAVRSARKWEIVGFVGAGVFATTWLVLTLTEPPSSSGSSTGASVPIGGLKLASGVCVPMLSTSTGGTCAWRF